MPKKPNHKSKPVKRDEPMTNAMKFFLLGCVAELYLLIVRRFYVNGSIHQVIAWYDVYLRIFLGAGVAALALGVALIFLWKNNKKRTIGISLAAIGLFLVIATALILWNMSSLTLLTVLVPVIMLLGILWNLYDRECALALTILGVSLIALWVCRRLVNSLYLGTVVKAAVIVYLVVLAALAFLVKGKKLPRRILPANADPLPVYVACGLSFAALVVALFSSAVAYYAMWTLAIVVFALAVYYTVKQI